MKIQEIGTDHLGLVLKLFQIQVGEKSKHKLKLHTRIGVSKIISGEKDSVTQ